MLKHKAIRENLANSWRDSLRNLEIFKEQFILFNNTLSLQSGNYKEFKFAYQIQNEFDLRSC